MPPPAVAPRPEPVRSRLLTWGVAGALLALHGLLAWLVRPPAILTGGDDAVYLLLGRALRSLSYRDIFLAGSPFQAQYPPLFPALLAALGSAVGERLDLFLLVNVLWSMLALGLVFHVVRARSTVVALLVLAATATNPLLIGLAGSLRSEPMFMALAALAFVGLAQANPSRRALLLAGAAAIAATLTRSIGVTVIAALLVCWAGQRRWRAATALLVAAVVSVGPWLAWTVLAPDQVPGRSYVADLTYQEPRVDMTDPTSAPAPTRGVVGVVSKRVLTNVVEYGVRGVPSALSLPTRTGSIVDNLIWGIVIVGFGGVGLVVAMGWWPAVALWLVSYGLLLAVWPYSIVRFLAPVVPFVLVVVSIGAERTGRWVERIAPRWPLRALLPTLCLGGMMFGSVADSARRVATQAACDRRDPLVSAGCVDEHARAFFRASREIGQLLPDTSIVMTAKEGAFYYYSGRQAVVLGGTVTDPDVDLRSYLEAHGTRYLFLSHLKFDESVLLARLEAGCADIELVRAWAPGTLLLRFPVRDDSSASALPGSACRAIETYARVPWGNRVNSKPFVSFGDR